MLRNIGLTTLFALLLCTQAVAGTFSVTSSAPKSGPQVELYATSWCGYCKKARAFFNARGIKFTEYDIEKDARAAARKQQLDPNGRGVPFAVINGQKISGFSEALYQQALESAQ